MNDELDKKLRSISIDVDYVATPRNVNPTRLSDTDIEQIKQAFIDERWIKIPTAVSGEYKEDGSFDWTSKEGIYRPNGNSLERLMTGQEWYEKFEQEANSIDPDTPIGDSPRLFALQVARKAAGIE